MVLFQIIKNIFKPINKLPRHLGRWKISNDYNLKIDYANIDSCGDKLCGLPNQFKVFNHVNNVVKKKQ